MILFAPFYLQFPKNYHSVARSGSPLSLLRKFYKLKKISISYKEDNRAYAEIP
jgi:hypothetical protein